MDSIKKNKINILLAIGYIILMLPMCFSMFYSVPNCDDFAFGADTVSDNLLINAAGYVKWNWLFWSGRWLTFFIQKLTIPLNLHTHMGHIYGIVMVALFVVFSLILIYALNSILKNIVKGSDFHTKITTFVIVAILFSTNYYSEAFNWYIGSTAYVMPMVLMLLSVALAIKYFQKGDNKYYYGFIAAGIYPAVNEMFDVPLGILYVYLLYLFCWKKKKDIKVIKNYIPLIIYVLLGMSNVFAPGNSGRQTFYEVKPSFVKAIVITVLDIVIRVQDIIVDHPLAVLLFIVLIILGVCSNTKNEKETDFIPFILTAGIATFGALFPYVYARGFTSTYIDVRMEYLVEYLLIMSAGVLCIKLGRWITYKYELLMTTGSKLILTLIMVIYAYVSIIQSYAYLDVVQISILRSRALIVDSYNLWDGILAEIEASPDDDVVIHRDHELEWSPYFIYSGLTNGEVFDVPLDTIYGADQIMINVYYHKNSIQLIYDNEMVDGE